MDKKKYRRPTVKTWGTVQELTQAGPRQSMRDLQGGNNKNYSGSRPFPALTD
ncbi:MAG: hypothetical protein JW820_01995 [Spirochaetales bacterium]|nr:hypothetical protein [Spirochaetales bacterium]